MSKKGNFKHGFRWTRGYTSWNSMMNRCNNPNDANFFRYGAKGIKVCKRWHNIKNFFEDMGVRPVGKTLGRINGSKGYNPSNCRWETPMEQGRNTTRNVYLDYKGSSMTLAEWSRKLNINRNTLKKRWRSGWSPERILESPVIRGRRC